LPAHAFNILSRTTNAAGLSAPAGSGGVIDVDTCGV
jgi:hypothetical protein